MKNIILLVICILSHISYGQLSNNAFDLNNDYGDLQMRRYVSGDLTWKRALVSNSNLLSINHGGDYVEGTKISGSKLIVDGNLGLGTTNPNEKLHIQEGNINVFGFNSSRYLRFTESNLQGGFINYDGSTNVFHIGVNNVNSTDTINDYNAISIVRSTGKIGMGITNPEGDLELNGLSQRLIFSTSAANQESSARIEFWEEIGARTNPDYAHFAIQYDGANDRLRFKGKNGTNLDDDLFTIRRNGNVGVGTINPDSKLTVKGKIHAEEVKIDLSVPAPDYVFAKEYDLLSIEEVQQYISEKGHLPNIPSAAAMEANGVELGIMNMKLLEKIEELTLYTIEQEKKLKKLETLEKENKILTKELDDQNIRINKLEVIINEIIKKK